MVHIVAGFLVIILQGKGMFLFYMYIGQEIFNLAQPYFKFIIIILVLYT